LLILTTNGTSLSSVPFQSHRIVIASQAIISASQVDQLRAQVVKFPELDDMFDDILGLGDVYAVSKVQLAKDYLSRKGYDPADTVFLGDTSHDAEVARAIGCRLPDDFRRAPVRRGAASGAGR